VTAYYNEIDPAACAVLRQLIADGVIAPGDVDTRSIKEVSPDDLRGYTQCHFFAGGGLWSVAARMAGWPDDRPLWTGSCPCQPFSAAGKGLGTNDPRHLWPDFHRLIRACRPPVVMGEQVAGAAGYAWFDGVRADLESEGYTSRGVDIPACAVDAPHQRNRLYWIAVGDTDSTRAHVYAAPGASRRATGEPDDAVEHAEGERRGEGRAEYELRGRRSTAAGADAPSHEADGAGTAGVLGDRSRGSRPGAWQPEAHYPETRRREYRGPAGRNGSAWADAEWITCHDGKARRAKSGLRLLVDGLPGRVDLWRVGGNAIVPALAAEVISAFLDAEAEGPL
jgi:DNA (cytosine-5)-methyltransferase 1